MKDKKTTRRTWSRAILGFVCLLFATEARAIELFKPVPLPDDGHGSTALGWAWTDPLTRVRNVVGSKTNTAGMIVPVIWSYKNVVPIWSQFELPVPTGNGGEALGGATLPDGDMVVVGNVFDRASQWGVVWRKPALGSWGMPQVLCQDSEQSWVTRADYCGDGILAVAGSSFEGGRWRAVLHMVSAIDVTTIDLPAPAGSNAAALSVYCMGDTATHELWAGGWISDRQGRQRPMVWANTGNGWATFPTDFAFGQVNSVRTTGPGVWSIRGDAMRGGRTMGFAATMDIGGHEISHGLLQPLDGFLNSSAIGLSTDGGVTFGKSMNPGGPPVATGWIGDSPFAVGQLIIGLGNNGLVRSFMPADIDNSTFGQIVAEQGGEPQACVFRPTPANVPERMDVGIGNLLSTESGNSFPLTSLWHTDDQSLRIRTERAGGMQRAVVDLQFTALVGPGAPTSIEYSLIARAEANQSNASGTLTVNAFNFSAQTWVPVGSFALSSTFADESGAINPALRDPQSGAVRLRLEFIPSGSNSPLVLRLNTARLYMDDPTRDG